MAAIQLFTFLWCSIFYTIHAYPEHGFSGYLTESQELTANTQQKIHPWRSSVRKMGQYSENMVFNGDSSEIHIKKEGLYFITFNIEMLLTTNANTVHASLIINNNINEKTLETASKMQTNSSVSASGFISVRVGDVVSVYVMSTSPAYIDKSATLHFRYHNALSALPGFLFAPSEDKQLTANNATLGPWKIQQPGHFTTSSSFREHLSAIQVPVSGVYMFCLNLIIELNGDQIQEIRFVVNEETKASSKVFYVVSDPVFTHNFNDLVYLNTTDIVTIEIISATSAAIAKKESTFSILLVKSNSFSANGFRAHLSESYNISGPATSFTNLNHWQTTIDYQFLSDSTIVDESSFSIEQATGRGVYYVVTNIIADIYYDSTTSNHGKYIDVAFNGLEKFQSKRVYVFNDSLTTDDEGRSIFKLSVNLVVSALLSKQTPIAVAIMAEDSLISIFNNQSSFSVLQAKGSYPGMHAALHQSTWLSSMKDGLYDFTNALDKSAGVYTAPSKGIYLITTNVVYKDVDNILTTLLAKDFSEENSKGFVARDSNPVQEMSMNAGGFMQLEIGDTISISPTPTNDTDFQRSKGGLSVTYISSNSVYFQAKVFDSYTITYQDATTHYLIEKWEVSNGMDLVENGKVTLPYTGIYYTIGSIILEDADKLGAYFKVNLKLDNAYVKGIYGKRKIGFQKFNKPIHIYTLFFSGSFYGKKGSILSVEMESPNFLRYSIVRDSSWGLSYLANDESISGSLADIGAQKNFRSNNPPWQALDFDFPGSNKDDGRYERTDHIQFESPIMKIASSGVYLISVNVEVKYTKAEKILFKLSVVVNENEGDIDGMTIWQKAYWDSETIHVTGGIFLNAGDMIEVKLSSDAFTDIQLSGDSGFSIVKIPEEQQSSSFSTIVNEHQTIDYEETQLRGLKFSSKLRSSSVQLNDGIATISYSGLYVISSNLAIENYADAEGVWIHLKVNGIKVRSHSYILKNESMVIQLQEMMNLTLHDVVTVQLQSLFNETILEEEYTAYLHHINVTANATLSNPYHALNASLSTENSCFTLLYMPKLLELSGWSTEFLTDVNIPATGIDTVALSPWKGADSYATFIVEKTGIYLMMATVFLEDAKNFVEIAFGASPSNVLCAGRLECTSTCNHAVIINCISNLTFGENIKIYIKTDDLLSVQQESTRAINHLGESVTGFSMMMSNSEAITFNSNWVPLSNWSKESAANRTFVQDISMYKTDFVFHVGGTYGVSLNLFFQVDGSNQSPIYLEGGVFVNGILEQSLHKRSKINSHMKQFTFNSLGGLMLNKWDRVTVMLNSSVDVKLTLTQGSTIAIVLTEPAPYSSTIDIGPVMLSKLEPDSYSNAVMAIKKTWECQSSADGVILYTWYKDGAVYQVDNDTDVSVLAIAGYINDTGTFVCEAEYMGLKVKSNSLKIDIYDIDECSLKKDDCSTNAICTNTPGFYECTCKTGYSGDGFQCEDTSECAASPCGLNTNCTDIGGDEYECRCLEGFVGNPDVNCTDDDECQHENDCHEDRAYCINFPGGYNCSCLHNWSGGNYSNGINCSDLNECEIGNFTCDMNAQCNNTNGSYACFCNEGYSGDGKVCTDINECLPPHEIQKTNNSKCVEYAVCVNEPGDYGCKCDDGFTGNGTVECIDNDECLNTPCNSDADCWNEPGSYRCTCRSGFAGDGFNCADVNECDDETDLCGPNGNCTNMVGDYTCACRISYRLNVRTCEVDPAQVAAITDECILDSESFACLCRDPVKREDNIMCNGLFVALIILCLVALVVIILLYKYLKSRKLMKIKPAKHHREKYIEMDNETEI